MDIKVPFCHYTYLDNLYSIIEMGQLRSRKALKKGRINFEDISIDPDQSTRENMGLTSSVPIFIGYYTLFRKSRNLWKYLRDNYESPKIQNTRFYGALHKTIKNEKPDRYERVVTIIIHFDKICESANKGLITFYTDIAIKSDSECLECLSKDQLLKNIEDNITINERGGKETTCEIDLYEDGENFIKFPQDIEAIVVSTETIKELVHEKILTHYGATIAKNIPIFVDALP